MAGIQGTATFVGTTANGDAAEIASIEQASFVLTRGPFPSSGFLSTPILGQTLPTTGDLELAYGGATITLSGMRVAEASVASLDIPVVNVRIEDRRWRWSYQDIVGRYNVREGTGAIRYEKSPQDLAALIFEAIGETDYDVSAMPNLSRPFVDWQNEPCSLALAGLLASVGCDVAPDLATGGWVVFPLGEGAALPSDGTIEHPESSFEPSPAANRLRQVGGDVRYECRFELEAVGLETDLATFFPIDELSYRPAGGWSGEHESQFAGVTARFTDDDGLDRECRDLALATVYRCYRIKSIVGGGGPDQLDPPGFEAAREAGAPSIETVEQLLPLLPDLNRLSTTAAGDQQSRRPQIHGQWFDGNDRTPPVGMPAGMTAPNERYKGAFSVDLDRGIVQFGEPMLAIASDFKARPATLYLTAVCQPDWVGLNRKVYYAIDRTADGTSGDLVATSFSRAVTLKYTAIYNVDALTGVPSLERVDDNRDAVDDELGYYLDAFENRLTSQPASVGSYADLKIVNLDGAIEQIAWEIGPGGTTTRIGRNGRLSSYLPSYEDVQRAARSRKAAHANDVLGEPTRIGVLAGGVAV